MTKAGRPTKFKPEYCNALLDFFSRPAFTVVSTAFGPKRVANELPTFHQFAKTIGVNEDTIVEWAKPKNVEKYPGFSAAYKEAKVLQKYFLIENGLNGVYNPRFAIFTAQNITDMRERMEVTGKDGEPLAPVKDIASKTADELLRILAAKGADSPKRGR